MVSVIELLGKGVRSIKAAQENPRRERNAQRKIQQQEQRVPTRVDTAKDDAVILRKPKPPDRPPFESSGCHRQEQCKTERRKKHRLP